MSNYPTNATTCIPYVPVIHKLLNTFIPTDKQTKIHTEYTKKVGLNDTYTVQY